MFRNGNTSLIIACDKRLETVALALMKQNADVNAKDNYELTTQQLLLKDSIIIQYQSKEKTFLQDIQNLNQVIQHKEDLRLISEKKAKKYKRQKNGMLIGGGVAAIGIIILRLVL